MALTPEIALVGDIELETTDDITMVQPSRTIKLDFQAGTLGGYIDEEEAIRQFAEKALRTARSRFLIYDDDYGCEIEDLLGQTATREYIDTEIPRMIQEALIYDDRIDDVNNFIVDSAGDTVTIEFTIVTLDGTEIIIEEEV
jgi:phage baseplate assembly protein W